jgi:hypothetical protein
MNALDDLGQKGGNRKYLDFRRLFFIGDRDGIGDHKFFDPPIVLQGFR